MNVQFNLSNTCCMKEKRARYAPVRKLLLLPDTHCSFHDRETVDQRSIEVDLLLFGAGMHNIRPAGQMWPAEAFNFARQP